MDERRNRELEPGELLLMCCYLAAQGLAVAVLAGLL